MEKRTALVQDDKPIFSGSMSLFLSSHGFAVDVSTNGKEGLEMAMKKHYDIVFTDIEMPNMNGFEFCARLKKLPAYLNTPVVFCSTLDAPEHKKKAQQLGSRFYRVKPMSGDAMMAILKELGWM